MSVNDFERYAFPLIRRVLPSLIEAEILSGRRAPMVQHPSCPECKQQMRYQSQTLPDGRMTQWWVCESTLHHPLCPECDSPTILRLALQGPNVGKHFWGCSSFPKCKGTVPYPLNEQSDMLAFTKKLCREMGETNEDWKLYDDSLWLDERHLSGWYREAWKKGELTLDHVALDQLEVPIEALQHASRIIFYPTEMDNPQRLKVLKSSTEILGVYPVETYKPEIPKHVLDVRGRSQGRMSEAAAVMVEAAKKAIKAGCEHLVFDTMAHPEGSGVKNKRHCECCHQACYFEKYDEVSEDSGIPLKHEWRTWHVICDPCMTRAHGRYKTRLRQMPADYRQFVYAAMPQIRRQGLRQLDDSRPPEKPACFGGIKSMYVDEHKSHECMLCIHEHKCHAEAFEFWRTEAHPDECHCEQCESKRKSLVDQIVDLSNDIKRKERETGKVPNTIPPKSLSMPIVKHKLPSLPSDQIVAVQPMTARSENIFMEKNADGTQTMCFKPSTPYNWRYVLRPVVKLERRRSSGWDPESCGASRRDGWDS